MPEERIDINGDSYVRISRVGVASDHPAEGGSGGTTTPEWGDILNKPDSFNPTTFVHNQIIASDTVVVQHDLGRRPAAVSILDTADNEVEADVQHNSINQLVVTFSVPFSGDILCI